MPAIPAPPKYWAAQKWAAHRWAMACLLLVAMTGAFLFGSSSPYGSLTRPTGEQAVTFSSITLPGTAETLTTSEAGKLLSLDVQATIPVEQSREFNTQLMGQTNPSSAALTAAPQATPAPAATYFQ
jgi:hypothetical protein